MPETITIALISLAGMVIVALINMIANNSTSKKTAKTVTEQTAAEFDKRMTVYKIESDAKIDKLETFVSGKLETLTAEVREQRSLSQKVPLLEEKVNDMKHHIEDLERRVGA